MAISKSPKQILDQQVEDWEKSSKPQSFQVPAATYICDLDSGGLETTKPDAEGKVSVMAIFVFVSKSPLEGRQLRLSRFCSSQNKDGVNYGIGQFLDECDVVLANCRAKPTDRSEINSADDLEELIESVVKMRPTDIPIIADVPGKSASGKTFQNLHVGLPGTPDGDGGATKLPKKDDKVQYGGKEWVVVDTDDTGVTLKRGKTTKAVTFEDLQSGG